MSVPTTAGTGGQVLRRQYPVLRIPIDAVNPEAAVRTILDWVDRGTRAYVCFANVHAAMEAWRDPRLAAVYAGAGLSVPDGMPLVWLGRLRGHPDVRRVYGPDLTLALADELGKRGRGVYLYGGAPGVAEKLSAALRQRAPGLRVVGTESPPFRPLTTEEDEAAVARINAARPDAVLVGLGCPKQERWMMDHRPHLEAPVLLGVGAAFDFVTGQVRQAPRWMMSAGLEWLFRFSQEPRRLAGRYLLNNPLFVALVLAELVGMGKGDREDSTGGA